MNEWIKKNHNLRVNPKKEPKRSKKNKQNKQKVDKINKNKVKFPKIQLSKMITNHNK